MLTVDERKIITLAPNNPCKRTTRFWLGVCKKFNQNNSSNAAEPTINAVLKESELFFITANPARKASPANNDPKTAPRNIFSSPIANRPWTALKLEALACAEEICRSFN